MRRRIVIELAPAEPGEEALRAAAELAARARGELLGLFIEDPQLFDFAALPIAHEIGLASAVRRRLEPAALERLLRAEALEAERRLARAAQAASVPWAFRIQREPPMRALIAAAAEALDERLREQLRLLLFGEAALPLERRVREACAELSARERAPRAELVHARTAEDLAAALAAGAAGVLLASLAEAALRIAEFERLFEQSGAQALLLPAPSRARRRY